MAEDKVTHMPLKHIKGHIFVKIDGEFWLIDTGSPKSFGAGGSLTLGGKRFALDTSHINLNTETLSQFVDVPCAGLLGMDILGHFDIVFAVAEGKLSISTESLQTYTNSNYFETIRLDEFMGIPVVNVVIRGIVYRMFFDSGAQISYFQCDSLTDFSPAGSFEDFYPGVGLFKTETYDVPMSFPRSTYLFRCGVLTETLGSVLISASAQGIIDNTILRNRTIGFYPRRHKIAIGNQVKGTGGYRYDKIDGFHNGFAVVHKKYGGYSAKLGCISETGKEISPCKYDYFGSFHDGAAVVGVGGWDFWGDCSYMFVGRWGCVDKMGNEIVPVGKYKEVWSDRCRKFPWDAYFSESMLAVCNWETGKWGFVDNNGNEVIQCKYDIVERFRYGKAKAVIDDGENRKWVYLDKTGKETDM